MYSKFLMSLSAARLTPLLFLLGTTAVRAQLATAPTPEPPPPAVIVPAPRTAAELERELAAAEVDKKQLSDELALAWKETEQAHAESAAAQKRADAAIKKNLADQSTQLTELKNQVQQSLADREKLQKQLADLQNRPAPTPAPVAVAPVPKTTDLEMDTKLASALRSYTLLEQENTRLRDQLAAQQHELSTQIEKVQSLENAAATPRTEALTAAPPQRPAPNTEAEDRLAVALRSFALLQSEAADLRVKNAALAQEKAVLNSRLAEAQAAIPMAAQAVALREQLRQTQDQSAAFAEENARLRNEVSLSNGGGGSGSARSTGSLNPQTINVAPDAAPAPATTTRGTGATMPAATVTTASPASTGTAATAATPASTPAPARTHVIAAGETLSKISLQYYGTVNRWASILAANRDVLRDEKSLPVGRTLRIP